MTVYIVMKSVDLNGIRIPIFVSETLYGAKQFADIQARDDGYTAVKWTTETPYKLTRYHLGLEDNVTLYSIDPVPSNIQV